MRPRRGGAVALTTAEVVLWVFDELTCIGSKMGTARVERVRHAFRGGFGNTYTATTLLLTRLETT